MTARPPPELTRSDFDYPLPAELIAQAPLSVRSASRLLLLDAQQALWRDRQMAQLPELLDPGDLLVFGIFRCFHRPRDLASPRYLDAAALRAWLN